MTKRILDQNGNPVVLNDLEKTGAGNMERLIKNAGYEVDVTTLTTIMKSIVEQKFFEVPFADYVPVKVGEGAWSSQLTTFTSYVLGDDFATGVMGIGSSSERMASINAQISSINVKVANWGKTMSWSLFDLQAMSKAGNFDMVVTLEKARKKNWDLGIIGY